MNGYHIWYADKNAIVRYTFIVTNGNLEEALKIKTGGFFKIMSVTQA